MDKNPLIDNYFSVSSHSSSHETLHYYTNPNQNYVPIKYYIKTNLEYEDYYLNKTFYLRTHKDKVDYDLDFLDVIKRHSQDSLLQTPIEFLLEEIKQEKDEKDREPPKTEQVGLTSLQQKDLWTTKYMPRKFDQLLSDERINREVLCWLKSWDPIVFPDKKKPKPMPIFMSPKKPMMSPKNEKFEKNPFFIKKNFNTINFDLDDQHSLNQLQNNIILLAGPPGTGKTTLARIIANHCGYKPIEINASDDRTADKLIEKIETACHSHSLNVNEKESKPTLIILDEVDGTADYEGKGTMKRLLDYIFKGEKKKPEGKKSKILNSKNEKDKENNNKNDEVVEKEEDDELLGKPKQQNQKIQIKRPIIFICNDIYAKGLRELRKKAIVFHFRKTSTDKLMARLREICNKEKILADHDFLMKLCESNDNDIRSCLNTLELISRNKKEGIAGNRLMNNLVLKETSILANKKENTKTCLDIVEDLIYKNQKTNNSANMIGFCLGQISRSVEYQILFETIFYNYTKIKQCERDFEKMTNFLSFLSGSEVIENLIKRNQLFELSKFTMLPCVYLNRWFSSNERVKVDFPYKMSEFKKETKISSEKVHTIVENYPLKSMIYLHPNKILQDIFSNVFKIIQPSLTSSILNENEKQDVQTAIFIMLDFSLNLLSIPYKYQIKNSVNPNSKEFYEMEYSPSNIEKLLIFGNIVPQKALTQRTKIIIQNNYEYLKNLRQAHLLDDNKHKNESFMEEEAQKNKMLENDYYNQRNIKKRRIRNNDETAFIYKFLEGVNNSIKYDVQIDMFFPQTS